MQLIKNNAYSALAGALTNVATSLTVTTGTGDRFPIVTGSDYCMLTLQDASNNIEIIKVTARASASDSMTIARGQEGTTARAWNIGDVVELRITAGTLNPLQVMAGAATAGAIRTALGSTGTGDALFTAADAAAARTAIGATATGSSVITAADAATARSNLGLVIGTNVPSPTGGGASGTWGISVTGNAGSVTNGVYTTGSYADPSWITSLAGAKISGAVTNSNQLGGVAASNYALRGQVVQFDDLTLSRAGAPSTGVLYLGNTALRYLYYDGTNYVMPSANLLVNGGTVITSLTIGSQSVAFANSATSASSATNANTANTALAVGGIADITQATTSGNSWTLTGIASNVNRIDVLINSIAPSTGSPSNVTMQLGTSGGLAGSGYYFGANYSDTTPANTTAWGAPTSSIPLFGGSAPTMPISGVVNLVRYPGTNTWHFRWTITMQSNPFGVCTGEGQVALAGVLDRINLTIPGMINAGGGSFSLRTY